MNYMNIKGFTIKIFLSYSRCNTEEANIIDKYFSDIGVILQRDIRDIQYKDRIHDFMNLIQKSDFVIMLISNEFLTSEYCLYEVIELLNSHEFEKKILPIVIKNAEDIYKPESRTKYYQHWLNELKNAEKRLTDFINEDFLDHAKRIRNISIKFDEFIKKLASLNLLTFDNLKNNNFEPILKIIDIDKFYLLKEILPISELAKKDPEEAEIKYDKLLVKYPNNPTILLHYSRLIFDSKKYKKLRYMYEEMIEQNPLDFLTRTLLGQLLEVEFKEYDLARYQYEKAIESQPAWNQGRFYLGTLLEKHFNDYNGARRIYEEAIERNWNHEDVFHALGILLISHFKEYNDGAKYLEKALDRNPENSEIHFNIGLLLKEYTYNSYDKAISHFEKVIDLNNDDSWAHFHLAELYQHNDKEWQKARSHFEKAVQLNPSNASFRYSFAKFLGDCLNNYDVLIREIGKKITYNDDHLLSELNEILRQQSNDYQNCKLNYLEATKLNPDCIDSSIDKRFEIIR